MDILALAKINELKKNGGVGYYETKKESLIFTIPTPYTEKGVIDGDLPVVKISDCVPTQEEMSTAYVSVDGEIIPVATDMFTENILLVGDGVMFVVYGNNESGLSSGIWLNEMVNEPNGDQQFVIPSTTITITHTIDPKFLPTEVFDLNNYKGVVTSEGQAKGAELSLTDAIQYAYGLGEAFVLESAEIDDFENEVNSCNKEMKFKLSLNGNTHLLSPSDICIMERGKALSFYLFLVDEEPIIKMGFCISTDNGAQGNIPNPGIRIIAKAL